MTRVRSEACRRRTVWPVGGVPGSGRSSMGGLGGCLVFAAALRILVLTLDSGAELSTTGCMAMSLKF